VAATGSVSGATRFAGRSINDGTRWARTLGAWPTLQRQRLSAVAATCACVWCLRDETCAYSNCCAAVLLGLAFRRQWMQEHAHCPSPVNLNLRNATLVEFDLGAGCLGSCDFRGARFVGQTRLDRCRIVGEADFTGAIFDGPVAFDGTTVRGEVSFRRCQFLGAASFVDASFQDHVCFDDALFQASAMFALTDLGPSFTFDATRFGAAADFSLARASMLRPSTPPEGWATRRSGNDPQTVLFVRVPVGRVRPKTRGDGGAARPPTLPQPRSAGRRQRRRG